LAPAVARRKYLPRTPPLSRLRSYSGRKSSSSFFVERFFITFPPRPIDRSYNPRRHAKSIVRISELRWNAAPGGTARELDVMTPGAAAGTAALAVLRAGRILLRRNGVIQRVVPIGAPFVHVLAHVEQAIGVGFGLPDRLRSFLPASRRI